MSPRGSLFSTAVSAILGYILLFFTQSFDDNSVLVVVHTPSGFGSKSASRRCSNGKNYSYSCQTLGATASSSGAHRFAGGSGNWTG